MRTYTNAEILTAVLVEWAKPMVDTVIAELVGKNDGVVAANEWVKKYFPVAKNYSIVNDLSFLAVPATEMVIEPMVRNGVARLGLDDKRIPDYAAKVADSLNEEAERSGKVTLFNALELEKSDIDRLRALLRKNLPAEEFARYEVIQ